MPPLQDPLRGDKLILGQVFPTRMLTTQQQLTSKRLLEAFADVAAGEAAGAAPGAAPDALGISWVTCHVWSQCGACWRRLRTWLQVRQPPLPGAV